MHGEERTNWKFYNEYGNHILHSGTCSKVNRSFLDEWKLFIAATGLQESLRYKTQTFAPISSYLCFNLSTFCLLFGKINNTILLYFLSWICNVIFWRCQPRQVMGKSCLSDDGLERVKKTSTAGRNNFFYFPLKAKLTALIAELPAFVSLCIPKQTLLHYSWSEHEVLTKCVTLLRYYHWLNFIWLFLLVETSNLLHTLIG